MKIRVYPIVVMLVVMLTALVIGLQGTIPQRTLTQIDGMKHVTTITGLSFGELLWSDDFTNRTFWRTLKPSTASASLQVNKSLNLYVSFSSQQSPQSVLASRTLNITLDDKPIVALNLTASSGGHYGVHFSGVTASGAGFEAWQEASRLQHRLGLGVQEAIIIDLALETNIATGEPPSLGTRITHLAFYLEAPPGTSGEFSLSVKDLEMFSLVETRANSNGISGEFRALIIDLDSPFIDQGLFQVMITFDIKGARDLRYTPYFTRGLIILAQGFTYVTKSITSYEIAALTPQRVSSIPAFLSKHNSSSSVVFVSHNGNIEYFRLNGLALRYVSTPVETAGLLDPGYSKFLVGYYFLFLFITPIAAVILLDKVFSSEK